jgi:DNA polymerase I
MELGELLQKYTGKPYQPKDENQEKTQSHISKPYYLVTDERGLKNRLTPLVYCEVFSIGIETVSESATSHEIPILDKEIPIPDTIRLIRIAVPDKPVIVIDWWSILKANTKPLKELLDSPATKIFHNAKQDLKLLSKAGFSVKPPLFDTMLASRLLMGSGQKPHEYMLANLTWEYLRKWLSIDPYTREWKDALTPAQLEYTAKASLLLLSLKETLISKLKEEGLTKVAELEFKCLPAVVEMEMNGIRIDTAKWKTLKNKLKKDKAKASKALMGHFKEDVDLNNSEKVLEALKKMGIKVKDTNRTTLIPLAIKHPVVDSLLDYRKKTTEETFSKSLSKHIHPITKKIHPKYNQIGAVTGRFSCSDPNLHSIPKDEKFRSCFIPEPGYKLVIADYSQIELRIAAEITEDKRMIKAFKKGEDLHRLTASLITKKPLDQVTDEDRRVAKPVNFGLIFGMGPKRLQIYAQESYGVEMSEKKATAFRERFFKGYPELTKWIRKIGKNKSKETRTLSGRRRQWQESAKLTELCNAPIQGTGADIVKEALGMLMKSLKGTGSRIIGCIHDEILVEAPEDSAEEVAKALKKTMEKAGKKYLKKVPVIADVEVANSWAEK